MDERWCVNQVLTRAGGVLRIDARPVPQ